MRNPQIELEILSVIKELESELLPSFDETKKAVYESRLKGSPVRTLEDIGNEFYLVRERVRQIEDDLRLEMKKQLNSRINLEQAINGIFSEYGKLLPINKKKLRNEDAMILEGFFQKGYTFYIDATSGIISPDKEVITTLYEKILSGFPIEEDIKSWNYNEIHSEVERKIKKIMYRQCTPELCLHLTSNITNYIVESFFTNLAPLESNNYLLKEGKKRTETRKLEYFFKSQYRLGVSIPLVKDDEIDANLVRLREALPDLKYTARHLRNKIVALEKVITWNDGTYIHIDNCSLDGDVLEDVVEKSAELFALGVDSFEARAFFDLYARKLIAKGIPNHIALYSLLGRKNDKRVKLVENKRSLLTISNPNNAGEAEVSVIPIDFFNNEELLKYPEAESNFRSKKSENCTLNTDDNIELEDTERDVVIKGRITQGKFRDDLLTKFNHKCALCGIQDPQLLKASHIKPWAESKLSPKERNDVENGLLLCTWHDALFDKGYISFDDDGSVIISAELEKLDFSLLNIDVSRKLKLSGRNKIYLKHHRETNAKKLVPFVKY